jgi:hypothetical protein
MLAVDHQTTPPPVIGPRGRNPSGLVLAPGLHLVLPLALFAVGLAVAVVGVMTDPERTWPNLLVDGFYVATLTLSAIFFLATQRLTWARWSAGLRRVPEALAMAVPVAAVLLLVVWLGRETLYPWSHPGAFAHEPPGAGKVQYLQTPFVLVRVVLAMALWIGFAFLFRRTSLKQDRHPSQGLVLHTLLNRYSAIFVIVFALSLTFSAFDWLISLDPSWFSTMFGVYVFIGTFVQGIAAVTLATVILAQRGHMRGVVGEAQLHDLGKMLFAFSTFWAYIWTSQFLLIWYADIPEEVTHYITRTGGWWVYLFALNFLVNWVVPFAVLLSARAKTRPNVLKGICILLLCGHWLDLYLIVMPSIWKEPRFGLMEIVPAIGWVAVIYAVFVQALKRAPLVPKNCPVVRGEALIQEHDHHLHGTAGMAHQHSGGERP